MQVKWLSKALQNLDNEADYIVQEDPAAAKLVVQRIFDSSTYFLTTRLSSTASTGSGL